jgi:hypothetical protein
VIIRVVVLCIHGNIGSPSSTGSGLQTLGVVPTRMFLEKE